MKQNGETLVDRTIDRCGKKCSYIHVYVRAMTAKMSNCIIVNH